MIPQYVTAQQLAASLGVSETSIFNYCDPAYCEKHGVSQLPSYRFGGLRRFREDEVLAWLEENSEGKGLAPVRELRSVS